MASHLLAAGHNLILHFRSGVPSVLSAAGGICAESPAAVAEKSEVIFLMLPDTPDVEAVLSGASGVAAGLSRGKSVVDMSSISPVASRRFAERLAALGVSFLDAPVSGGEVGAVAATLSIMVGGDADIFDAIRPYFALMGKNITHVGASGAGQTAKASNQIIVALTIAAVAEGLVFAAKAGVDPARVREAITGRLATSRILELHGGRMIDATFDPGFRIGLHQKDLEIALSTARQFGIPLPNTAAVQKLFNANNAAGESALDHSALVRVYERLAGVSLEETR